VVSRQSRFVESISFSVLAEHKNTANVVSHRRNLGNQDYYAATKNRSNTMKITQKMIEEGWKKNKDGMWVAPSEATKRVLLVENKDEPLGPGWVKVPRHDLGAQVSAFCRAGLSREEAEVAAGIKRPGSQKDASAQQYRESVLNFDPRHGNR
jgi:hypothetical protein